MKFFNKSVNYWRKALVTDTKTLKIDTKGQVAANSKTVLITSSIVLTSLLLYIVFFNSSSALSETPDIAMAANSVEISTDLYDNRPYGERDNTSESKLSLTLKSGQSLGPLLQKNGVEPDVAYAATQAFSSAYSPRNLRADQKINLYFDASTDTFSGLSLKPNYSNTVFVERDRNGDFKARKIEAEFKKDIVRIETGIENSLYLDAQDLGVPDKVIVQFSQIYAHSVDFQRDIHKGDKFEMLFEVYKDHQGNTIKAGDLLFASFSPRGKTTDYYLFTKSDSHDGYYDINGKGAKRMLMRTPISGARISSRFGKRKHPILGYVKNHTGVDFAAARGTPIMAGGTGTIVRAGRYGSYGNYIKIKHADGYATAYAHMSKFVRGIKKGRHVTQNQIIGYVGTTGRSTGPHLHYEVLKNGKRINPMRLSTLTGKPLKKFELPAFKTRVAEIDKLYQATQIVQKDPPAAIIAANPVDTPTDRLSDNQAAASQPQN